MSGKITSVKIPAYYAFA